MKLEQEAADPGTQSRQTASPMLITAITYSSE